MSVARLIIALPYDPPNGSRGSCTGPFPDPAALAAVPAVPAAFAARAALASASASAAPPTPPPQEAEAPRHGPRLCLVSRLVVSLVRAYSHATTPGTGICGRLRSGESSSEERGR